MQPRSSYQSRPSDTPQRVIEVTAALIDDFCQSAETVRNALEDGNVRTASKLWEKHNLQGQVKNINNFLRQASYLDRKVERESQEFGSPSGSSYTRHRSITPISVSDLPDDPDQLKQIINQASSKLTKRASA